MQSESLESTASPVSQYRELAPPPALAGAVICTWIQVVGDVASDYTQQVVPDGCVDLVWIGGAPPVAVGPATRAVEAHLPARTSILGLRFRPGMAPSLLGPPASELLDRTVALRDLWGRGADAVSNLLDRPTPAARLAAIEEALRRRSLRPVDPLAAAAVTWLARNPAARVDGLARELGVSTRQLHRRFAAAVGYGPKMFQRVARFQRLLDLGARPGPRPGLSQLALDAGYADQAHMTREVRDLAGRTPAVTVGVAGAALAMSDLLTT